MPKRAFSVPLSGLKKTTSFGLGSRDNSASPNAKTTVGNRLFGKVKSFMIPRNQLAEVMDEEEEESKDSLDSSPAGSESVS